MRYLFVSLFVLFCTGNYAISMDWDHPGKSDELDLAIPIGSTTDGEEWQIVMRRLEVPGDQFWLSSNRFIDLGQGGDASVFERPVSVEVRGTTRQNSGWQIWLGKYEVTVAQYALVMGEQDIKSGLQYYKSISGVDLDIEQLLSDRKLLNRTLTQPAHRIPPAAIADFMRRLNVLCYQSSQCREALPGVGSDSTEKTVRYLPFFRLPSEIEWEYAARGVSVDRDAYRKKLPVTEGKLENYAHLKNIRSIGTKRPIFGFYDLFGNVAELVGERMSAEIGTTGNGSWLAKGGRAARGGSSVQPYSSLREEVPEFEWVERTAMPRKASFDRVGFRMALGVPLQAFTALAKRERPTGDESTDIPDVIDTGDGLSQDFASILNELSSATRLDNEAVNDLNEQLQSAIERLQSRELKLNTRMAGVIGNNTLTTLVRIWTGHKRMLDNEKRIKELSEHTRETAKTAVERLKKMVSANKKHLERLMLEYESSVRVLADVPSINARFVDTLDLKTFNQSENTALMAAYGVKLLKQHMTKIQSGTAPDISYEVMQNYPLKEK